jgi:hypothetical protein
VFVSKNVLGYKIMKDIMAAESSKSEQGVPSFEYNAADARFPLLFELGRPLDQLEGMLLEHFAGRTLTSGQIFDEHHVGRWYVERNYKDGLRNLEAAGRIATDPPASKRRKNKGEVTFGPNTMVTFPRREAGDGPWLCD